MNIARLSRVALTVLTGLALGIALSATVLADAQAATALQRCAAGDGTRIYTDRPCALFHARPLPLSGELLNRIARDQAATAGDTGLAFAAAPARAVVARRSAASGCARSPVQLSMDLQGAWALGDINRIAESYHWVGLGQARARQIMQQLDRLAATPLLQARYFDARIGAGPLQLADAGSDGAAHAGVMQLLFDDRAAPHVRDFAITRYHGCYFLRF